MVGLGGCVFGGLSSFQTSYAAERALDYSLFSWFHERGDYQSHVDCQLRGQARPLLGILPTVGVDGDVGADVQFRRPTMPRALPARRRGAGHRLRPDLLGDQWPGGQRSAARQHPQALLLFSLGYFVGVFGFPWLAGRIIVEQGLPTMLLVVLGVALLNWLITVRAVVVALAAREPGIAGGLGALACSRASHAPTGDRGCSCQSRSGFEPDGEKLATAVNPQPTLTVEFAGDGQLDQLVEHIATDQGASRLVRTCT